MRPLTRYFTFILICGNCLVTASFIPDNFPAPITRTGLTNARVAQTDSCLLIYGINSTDNSLMVEMYDPQLRLVHQFTEKIIGFNASSADLQYNSELRLEFVVNDQKNLKQKFIFLDKELRAYYKSESAPKVTVLRSPTTRTLDKFRIDDFAWEIRTEQQDIGAGKTATITSLYQYGIKLLPAFPMQEVNRAIVLDSSAVEYAKVFLVRENRIYVYVNESTTEGKQFVYCFSGLDGALIYKTRLAVDYSETKKNADQSSQISSAVDACIFSNHYWDQKLNRLIVGGTWIMNSSDHSGIFLIQLDETGAIKAGIADEGSWLNSKVEFDPAKGIVDHRVNRRTYQRITKMGYQPDGGFVVLSELYGLKITSRNGDSKTVAQPDTFYHFFCIQAQYFSMQSNSVKLKNENLVFAGAPWSANYHLDSIAGFVPKVTKLSDELYANNVNEICDGSGTGYFKTDFLSSVKDGIKVLSTNGVLVSESSKAVAYFSKTIYTRKNSNCDAMLSPNPVHEQNFAERNDYYAIDANRLYRVTTIANGYSLQVISW